MKRIIFASCLALLFGLFLITDLPIREVEAERRISNSKHSREFVAGRVLVKFRSNISRDHARQIIAGLGARDADEIPNIGVHVLDLPFQASESAFVQSFEARSEVEFAELDRILPLQQLLPNDPWFGGLNSWSLVKINGPQAWAINTGNSSVVIAILDTGVDGTHPDLAAKMVAGRNIYDNNVDTSDVHGHGTAVAGQAAASSNNSIGVASVAWGCSIMPVRISDMSGNATLSSIASGLTWAADHGARVANVSYKATGSSTVSSAARYFQGKGGVVSVAAGNDGAFNSGQDDPYILTVGATDSADALFVWSGRGNNQDLVAPGTVATTVRGGAYGVGTGTSAAAPQVAGAAALVLSVNPNLTPGQVQNILKESADDLGAAGWDSIYGAGRINLAGALSRTPTGNGTTDVAPPSVTITSPSDGTSVSGAVNVLMNAVDDFGVVKVALYVDGQLYNASTNAPFTIKWNSRKAARGGHTLQARAYDAAGNVGSSAILTVSR